MICIRHTACFQRRCFIGRYLLVSIDKLYNVKAWLTDREEPRDPESYEKSVEGPEDGSKTTHVLYFSSLDLAVEIGPFQDLVSGHA